MNRHLLFLGAVLVGLSTFGCGGPKYMTPVQTPVAVAPDAAQATVVFIRPSGYGGGRYAVLDETGKFLGELEGKTYFVAKVPPGEHVFISWGEGTPALKATLEAGEIYYVEMGVTVGAWSARARLFAIGPQRKQWAELPAWLAESNMVALSPTGEQAFMQEKGSEIREVVQKGLANYAEYDAEAKQLRTLTPADGVAAPR